MQVNLTQKEKMLLEDQKSHEEICIQKYSNYANQVHDPQLKQICKNNEQIERSHLNTIDQLLSGNVPQMNQQQGGQQNQGVDQNVNKSQTATSNLSDKEICSDLLMTEKYVSGAYDTAIFEFKDTEVRDVLNHIQKEEQKHGESIFKYMESKGMYNVQ
ncbi:spore coat protein [Clostridium beijerinckii]|uniref:Spore coat protein CotF n=1 Tax=Clostridium beijerinckii TaxID=1520 RepID=A0A9Q5CM93_CLOBE|nr:spore coat protein [Clostridium beijerinckii]AQS05690.1 coat F domain protein [Clostridium beijerinckii]MBA2885317.1 spore coat protein CotF [Clostridium beijerinckii]MBA2900182.1 spore coat protein CotF [Clostridium beijerinckii]MBA2909811.1 spore coat protein CotF [Clostridium beijerinckii]MBA9014716.1 spore coat protein CotF [Clostridium beijerinckii]